jgi:hypothetical protein
MPYRPLVPMGTVFALLVLGGPATAQQPIGCPTVEEGRGTPVELRIVDFVLRGQITGDAGDAVEGTRVEGRLIGCERDPRIPADPVDGEMAEAAPLGLASMLRVLHDLTVGLELGPTRDGRCVRASIDFTDAAGGTAGTSDGQPLALELCGLPFGRIGDRPDAP